MTLKIECAGITDTGRKRERNEDDWSADPERGTYLVSDGMGGEFEGALASKLVAEALPPLVRKSMKGTGDLSTPGAARQVAAAIAELSNQLRSKSKGEPGLEGMGATVDLVLVRGSHALIGHMGDSRAYLLRDGELERLTQDHSITQLLLDMGEITPKEAATHPSRGQLTRYVGMAGEPLPETRLLELAPGDRILMCTDGLTGMLADDRLREILGEGLSLDETCRRLVAEANAAGGKDNITAVVLSVSESGTPGTALQEEGDLSLYETLGPVRSGPEDGGQGRTRKTVPREQIAPGQGATRRTIRREPEDPTQGDTQETILHDAEDVEENGEAPPSRV